MILPIKYSSIQLWLESFDSSIPVAREAFPVRDENGIPNRVSVPFIVYRDRIEPDGGDITNLMRAHDVTVEYYSEDGDDEVFEHWLYNQNLKYSAEQNYLNTEQLFESIFNFDTFYEKETRVYG